MTRKDYVLIAAALKDARSTGDQVPAVIRGVVHAAEVLANALSRDNPRFDRERFLTACAVQS